MVGQLTELTAYGRVNCATAAMAAGYPVIVVDERRGGVGELVFAATLASTDLLAFAVRHASGFVGIALTAGRCERLELPPMYPGSDDRDACAYRVTVDLVGPGTGLSATDRARMSQLVSFL